MQKRKLGRSGLEIAPLVFGGNVIGWTADEATSFSLLDAFVDAGFDMIDTADVYSRWAPGHVGGESEAVIGKWLKARGRRDRVLIATKVGSDMGEAGKGLSAKHIAAAVDASLKRLQTDYIDLYQTHWDDPETPIEETLGAYQRLVEAGKVRAIGTSNFTPERLKASLEISAAKGWPRYETLQPEYNLYAREGFEAGLRDLAIAEEIGVITYFSLASGFLTGKYRSEADFAKSVRGEDMGKYLNPRGLRIIAALDAAAAEHGATPTQIALAWVMAQPGVTAPIASATSLTQFADLAKSARLVLAPETVAALTEASA